MLNLQQNIGKAEEMVLNFGRTQRAHTHIFIQGMSVERVSSFRFLGVHISMDQTQVHCGEINQTAPVLPSLTKVFWNGLQDIVQLLMLLHQEYTDWSQTGPLHLE